MECQKRSGLPISRMSAKHCHGVADQADEGGGAGNRLIAFQTEQINACAQTECACAQSNGRKIDRDPQTPRHEIGEIGDPQSFPEDQDAGDQTAQQDDAQEAEP